MIVAITGGTGFIGKKLVSHLVERGDTVRLLTRSSATVGTSALLEIYKCDLVAVEINELSSMLEGVDVLYHCAGQLTNTSLMRELHVNATRKLVEAASGRIKHWVQLSSVGVYGPVSEGSVTEETPLNPVGDYEITKTESDRIVVEAANRGAFSYSILRPSNVFGADMGNQSLFGMVDMINKGLFFFIGKPGASANYIHVDNVVEGLIRCGTIPAAKGRVYNLSDYCDLELFVSYICRALGKDSPKLRLPLKPARWLAKLAAIVPAFPLTASRVNALTNRSRYSTLRIEKELGYVATVTLEAGMQEMVAAWKMTRQRAS